MPEEAKDSELAHKRAARELIRSRIGLARRRACNRQSPNQAYMCRCMWPNRLCDTLLGVPLGAFNCMLSLRKARLASARSSCKALAASPGLAASVCKVMSST